MKWSAWSSLLSSFSAGVFCQGVFTSAVSSSLLVGMVILTAGQGSGKEVAVAQVQSKLHLQVLPSLAPVTNRLTANIKGYFFDCHLAVLQSGDEESKMI